MAGARAALQQARPGRARGDVDGAPEAGGHLYAAPLCSARSSQLHSAVLTSPPYGPSAAWYGR
eukprot:1908690-Prymnesium_polylepis.1